MSEYQYYEFQALDRRLDEREMRALRDISTRARITPTSFVNHYTFGDLKADPRVMVEKYFDAFLYLGFWRTYELMFRLPRRLLDPDVASRYCCGASASVRTKGDFVILDLLSEDVDGDCEESGEGLLSSIITVRADVARGDLRVLYLAWLLCVQHGELEDDTVEPPVPPGLRSLTASLEAFADCLRIDPDLIAAAAKESSAAAVPKAESPKVAAWIAALPDDEKVALLLRVAQGDPHVEAELRKRFSEVGAPKAVAPTGSRTVAELLSAAREITMARTRKDADRKAAERARREREAASARERYLSDLAGRAPHEWRRVEALIALKQQSKYDEAVKLLQDLREIAVRGGSGSEADARTVQIACEHAKKLSLIERMSRAGLRVSMAAAR